ncbi:MAG: DegT/DnrJ/EryC1/StrS family aminotransferase, partial [Anaerolineaceae bacterium]|nr:DegT/DnrJ/EryC1/StrS family aminotransferase [Anaerolineaceae bacterium]
DMFQELLGVLPGVGFQAVRPGNRSSYKDFSVTIAEEAFGLSRDELALALQAENIDTRKYYEPPVHRQSAYRQFYSGQPLPNTEMLAANSLSFPMWSNMEPEIISGICEAVQRIYQNRSAVRNSLLQKAPA